MQKGSIKEQADTFYETLLMKKAEQNTMTQEIERVHMFLTLTLIIIIRLIVKTWKSRISESDDYPQGEVVKKRSGTFNIEAEIPETKRETGKNFTP